MMREVANSESDQKIDPSTSSSSNESNNENAITTNENKSEESGVWGWIKLASNNQFVQKVMEKTKTGVDKVITTLDPGMTPYIKEGGEVNIVVASDKEVKWAAIRDAFQHVFGAATVTGIASQPNGAPQPVGYSAGVKCAQERLDNLRKKDLVQEWQVLVAIESFVAEQLPEQWFDIACIILEDKENNISLKIFSLAVPIENDIIAEMENSTPHDYDLRWSGLAVTVGETIQKSVLWVNPSDWHRALTGRSRRDIIYSAALSLAELYKRRLPEKTVLKDDI